MAIRKKKRQTKGGWYSVSVDSLRAWAMFFALIGALVFGYFGYRNWERNLLYREATRVIEEAQSLIDELRSDKDLMSFRDEYSKAQQNLDGARARFQQGSFTEALNLAGDSRQLLRWIQNALIHDASDGQAQFLGVHGGVHFRRGQSGEWEPARSRLTLAYGDYVRTLDDGRADLLFADGTHTQVRQNTLLRISRPRGGGNSNSQEVNMQYGWVDLSTRRKSSSVEIPTATARVQQESTASVTYDRTSGRARFSAYRGGIDVESASGVKRRVGPRQQIEQVDDQLSSPRPLPAKVDLNYPPNSYQASREERLALSWEPVPNAVHYALQVARDTYFTNNVIDVADRAKTSATLGIQGDGSFFWRVAALGRDGAQGPWSDERQFRVTSFDDDEQEDTTPPRLVIRDVNPYGSIFILGGATEPGAELVINGESVTVAADGTFTKPIQLFEEGWSIVTLRARDAQGNETVRSQRVFVESY